VFALFDSGSNTDCILPDFCKVAGLKPFILDEQLRLQLGCRNSYTKILHSVCPDVAIGPIVSQHHFDVVNVDLYDVIIGTPFLIKHGVSLRFGPNELIIGSTTIPTILDSEGSGVHVPRKFDRKSPRSSPSVPEATKGLSSNGSSELPSVDEFISSLDRKVPNYPNAKMFSIPNSSPVDNDKNLPPLEMFQPFSTRRH
jgi:hypothetical protein